MGCFYEQFIGKDYGDKQRTIEGLLQLLVFMAIALSVIKGMFFGIAMLLAYGILSIVAKNIFLEYEYELTEDELVISKIMNKKRRKVIGKINIKEVTDIKSGNSEIKNGAKLIKASFEDGELKQQILYVSENSKLMAYKVSLDKKMISNCNRINNLVFRNI